MIATANLELSTRLQELAPGWETEFYWYMKKQFGIWSLQRNFEGQFLASIKLPDADPCEYHIAPDLDWLLGKLGYPTLERNVYGIWLAKYYKKTSKGLTGPMNALGSGSTPCDATCALLINLIETKVISV